MNEEVAIRVYMVGGVTLFKSKNVKSSAYAFEPARIDIP
jgi:hypothetical protein